MPIERINPELCTGCGTCVDSCMVDVIRMDEEGKKAIPRYPEDCTGCTFCVQDCPVNAISLSEMKTEPILVCWG